MIKTCVDMERWIKDNAASKVDGTYQEYAFRFVALQSANDTADYSSRDMMALFLYGIPKMSEEIVNEWIEMWREGMADIILCERGPEFVHDDIDSLSAGEREALEEETDRRLVKMLEEFFED